MASLAGGAVFFALVTWAAFSISSILGWIWVLIMIIALACIIGRVDA